MLPRKASIKIFLAYVAKHRNISIASFHSSAVLLLCQQMAQYSSSKGVDWPLDGCDFDSLPPRLVMEWVTVFGQANHLSISPSNQANSADPTLSGTEMSTSQNASFHLWINVWVTGTTM